MIFKHERMNDQFEKWHIEGLPFAAAIHHFTGPDTGDPHDHPFDFTTHVLAGGYAEEVFSIDKNGKWRTRIQYRDAGRMYRVDAEHIHRIVRLLGADCWTLIVPRPHRRETRFWRFDERGVVSRAWHEAGYPEIRA